MKPALRHPVRMVFLKLLVVFYLGCWLEASSSKMNQAVPKRNIGIGTNPWRSFWCVQSTFRDKRQCLNLAMLNTQIMSKNKAKIQEKKIRWNQSKQNRKEILSKKFKLSKLRMN